MKHERDFISLKILLTFFFLFCINVITQSQDNTNSPVLSPPEEQESWYSQPWIWIVGAVLLVVLLLSLLRRTKPTRSIADEDRIAKTIGTESDDERA